MTGKQRRDALHASRDRSLGRQYAWAALLRGQAKRKAREAAEVRALLPAAESAR